jgi:hypothetical protein
MVCRAIAPQLGQWKRALKASSRPALEVDGLPIAGASADETKCSMPLRPHTSMPAP